MCNVGAGGAGERAAGRYLVANALQHAFQFWFEADPKRPLFHRWLSTTKKLLGDNPDAVYYGAIADPEGSFRIRGNVHGACYTSFSIETGSEMCRSRVAPPSSSARGAAEGLS